MLLKAQAPISHPVPLSFLSEGHPFPRLHLWLLGHNPNDYPHSSSSSSIHSKCSTLPYSLHCIPPNLKKTPNSLLFQMFCFGISIFFFFFLSSRTKPYKHSWLLPSSSSISNLSQYFSKSPLRISPTHLFLPILGLASLLHSLTSALLQQFPALSYFRLYYLHALLHSACKYLINLHASLCFLQTLYSASFRFIQSHCFLSLITHFLCNPIISHQAGNEQSSRQPLLPLTICSSLYPNIMWTSLLFYHSILP